jgi:hypothetical protein
MTKIKGALLMEYVRLIRDNKDKDWKKYLDEEDSKIIFGAVMPNAWYPLEVYEHAGKAIFKEIAQGDLKNAKIWGRFVIEDLGNRFYHNLVRFQDPEGALERCMTFILQWFQFDDPNFQAIQVEKVGPKQVKMTLRNDHPYDYFEAYAYQSLGTFERIVELNGGKEVKAEITTQNYKSNTPSVTIMVSWK